jgi:hypothetical protein
MWRKITYLMTMIDRTTWWVKAVPFKKIAAACCVELFMSNWVTRIDMPETLTSDGVPSSLQLPDLPSAAGLACSLS